MALGQFTKSDLSTTARVGISALGNFSSLWAIFLVSGFRAARVLFGLR